MPALVIEHADTYVGARKALSIGIQYRPLYFDGASPRELKAAHRDPDVVKKILTQFYDYRAEDVVVLKDDDNHTLPTRENILKAIDDLVWDAKAGDRFVFHFSGHGSQIPDDNGDEEDGQDEVIWPVDIVYDEEKDEAVKNYIVDDELRERLVDALPAGTHLTVLLDCCHSGTGVDLPYCRSRTADEIDEEVHQLWSPVSPKGIPYAPFSPVSAVTKTYQGRGPLKLKSQSKRKGTVQVMEMPEKIEDFFEREIGEMKTKVFHDKHVTSWAACVDETLELESGEGGMLTMAFWNVLQKNRSMTHIDLYRAISEFLVKYARRGKKQVIEMGLGRPKPVLSSLQKLDQIHPLPFSF